MKPTRYFPVILAATALILSCEQLTEDYVEVSESTAASNTGLVIVRASVDGSDFVEAGGGGIPL
jgi:hypothetical protein